MQGYSGKVLTTDFVIVELANFFSRVALRPAFATTYDCLMGDPLVEIVPATQSLLDRGVTLYLDRSDKDWFLTDCISFVVMQDQGITDALTADRHFEQAGYRVLMA